MVISCGIFFVKRRTKIMKIIKNINNNFAIAIDGNGNRLIVSGKGIGFGSVPREITNLTIINRSFYEVDEAYISMINDIPEDIIYISTCIVDKAREKIDKSIGSNIVFTLAEHLNFCIQRYQKNMNIKLPIVHDVQHLFEKEYEIGEYGLKLIREKKKIFLPKDEAAYIALHVVNAEEQERSENLDDDEIIGEITQIVEREFKLIINKDNFNYSRFVSHMHYLIKRGKLQYLSETDNAEIFDEIKQGYPKIYECSNKVREYLDKTLKMKLNDEEQLYLMLHINRLCIREDCNQ